MTERTEWRFELIQGAIRLAVKPLEFMAIRIVKSDDTIASETTFQNSEHRHREDKTSSAIEADGRELFTRTLSAVVSGIAVIVAKLDRLTCSVRDHVGTTFGPVRAGIAEIVTSLAADGDLLMTAGAIDVMDLPDGLTMLQKPLSTRDLLSVVQAILPSPMVSSSKEGIE